MALDGREDALGVEAEVDLDVDGGHAGRPRTSIGAPWSHREELERQGGRENSVEAVIAKGGVIGSQEYIPTPARARGALPHDDGIDARLGPAAHHDEQLGFDTHGLARGFVEYGRFERDLSEPERVGPYTGDEQHRAHSEHQSNAQSQPSPTDHEVLPVWLERCGLIARLRVAGAYPVTTPAGAFARDTEGASFGPLRVSLAPARLLVGTDAQAHLPHDLVGEGRAGGVDAAEARVTEQALDSHAAIPNLPASSSAVSATFQALDGPVLGRDDLERPGHAVVDAVGPVLGQSTEADDRLTSIAICAILF